MRLLFALAALPLLTTFAPLALYEEAPLPDRPSLTVEAVPLDEENPVRRRLGGLVYLGGWALRSNDPRFGGISSMHVADGQVLAISDAGTVIRFALPGRPPALAIGPLADGPGSALDKRDRDVESLAVAGGQAWLGFERLNAVWRYSLGNWRSQSATAPPAMREWPATMGSEAMVRLANGNFLIFSEGKGAPYRTTQALLFLGDPAVRGTAAVGLRYRAPKGYQITDAALLPDGRMLFLNRRFTLFEGVSAKLLLGPPPQLSAGSVLSGREIASFRPPVTTDNYEALSVTRENGRTIVWIASDDNFLGLQRTLLLKFALAV